ncbi:MAG: hypothetical protein LV480_14170 [Methylacidiphilales bacterium]|nr:hypothetical protein [Candidatus Methylacidiphilales bacterium]
MSIRPTRKIVAEFVGVFLIGALAGALVTCSLTDTQLSTFMSRAANKPDSIAARLNKKYADEFHLTPDELNRIQPIVNEMAQQMYAVRHQFGVDILATLDKYHTQIAEQLTPEHRAAYEAAMAEKRKKLNSVLLPDQGSPGQGSQ